jgi:hypothetical protein
MVSVQVSRIRSTVTAGSPSVQVSRIRSVAGSTGGTGATVQVSRIRSTVGGGGTSLTDVEPFSTVDLGSGTWTQTSGPTVTVPTFTAPAGPDGYTLTFVDGSSTTKTVTVLPQTVLFRDAGVLTGLDATIAAAPVVSTMPGTNYITGYTRVYAEDFSTNIAIGGFDSDSGGFLKTTCAAYTAYHNSLMCYPEGWNASTYGTIAPRRILEVTGSHLIYNYGTDPTNGEYLAATVHPLIGPDGYYITAARDTYIEMRFRLDGSSQLASWGLVLQLIASAANWSLNHGELDAMEGSMAANAQTFWHPRSATNSSVLWGQQPWTDNYHVLRIHWSATHEAVWIDGILIGQTSTQVAQDPRAFLIQSGVNSIPTPDKAGRLLIDWIVAYQA